MSWQTIVALVLGGVTAAVTVVRLILGPRRVHRRVDRDWEPPPRAIRFSGIQFWQVMVAACFIAAVVIIVASDDAANRQGAWGLLGIVVGAIIPKP